MTSPPDEPAPRLAALRYHDFRLLWCGDLVSTVGSQMQFVAVNWHVYRLLKGSVYELSLWGAHLHLSAGALGLGTLGLVRVLPIIVFGLIGGVVADAHDRRRVIMWTQLGAAFFAAVLAAVTLSGHAGVAALYALTAAGSAVTAFDEPALQSLIPHLVPRRHLANAVSLNTLAVADRNHCRAGRRRRAGGDVEHWGGLRAQCRLIPGPAGLPSPPCAIARRCWSRRRGRAGARWSRASASPTAPA